MLDGNSHLAGVGGGQNITKLLAKTSPISVITHQGIPNWNDATILDGQGAGQAKKWQSDKGVVLTNLGISGQTWRKMNGLDGYSSADVDGAWVDGKINVLFAWEGTNSMASPNNRLPADAIQDARDYIAARRALHPGWIILVGTVAPRQAADQAATTALNQKIDTYNNLLRAQYKDMGANGLFDIRAPGSWFNFPDYLMSTFDTSAAATGTYWAGGEDISTGGAGHVHFSSEGNMYLVNAFILPALKRLSRR